MIQADVSGLKALEAALAQDLIELENREAERRAFLTHVTRLTPELRAQAPVDTGNLRSKIRCEWRNGRGFIIVDADYAGYVINGTSMNRANDFVTRAVDATSSDYEKRLRTELFKNTRRFSNG